MRGVTNSLAALLSILIVSTSMSASACDLSCWLRQTHSDCHAVNSAGVDKDDTTMSMPSGMDMGMGMGSGHSESMTGPAMSGTQPGHSMLMLPQMGMATERFESASEPGTGRGAMPDYSKGISSCAHEPCSQAWASASPPAGDHSQPKSPRPIAISISAPVNLRVAFCSIRVGTHPPGILASDRLVTTLRI
jgi:hypothetical protein